MSIYAIVIWAPTTHGFTSGDFQDLGRETNWTLNTKLLVLGPVNEIA